MLLRWSQRLPRRAMTGSRSMTKPKKWPVHPAKTRISLYEPDHPRSLISAFVVRCQDRMIPIVYIRNFKILAGLCSWADWFESYLVGNPEDRFSHGVAQLINTDSSISFLNIEIETSVFQIEIKTCTDIYTKWVYTQTDCYTYEPPHDKTNKMACAPSEDDDLSLRWAHSHFVGFVMRRLISAAVSQHVLKQFMLYVLELQVKFCSCYGRRPKILFIHWNGGGKIIVQLFSASISSKILPQLPYVRARVRFKTNISV